MLDHNVYLSGGACRLRPITRKDTDQVLNLWNQDYVVGNLFSGITSLETYVGYFDKYVADKYSRQWVVEDDEQNFVGTIGCVQEDNSVKIGWFALFPTKKFMAFVPVVLLNDYIFDKLSPDRIVFNINSRNHKIKKFHRFLGAEKEPREETVISRYGVKVVCEHWFYDRECWLANSPTFHDLF